VRLRIHNISGFIGAQTMKYLPLILSLASSALCANAAPWPEFRHHFISRDLPTNDSGVGDYGLTALVDLNRDGHPDFVLGGRTPKPERLYWFEYRGPDDWVQHEVGRDYQSDVGLVAIDVDGDGWPDLVCSGVWYRNPGKPTDQPWERFEFAENAAGAHDIVAADIDGDGHLDIVMMGDEHTRLNGLCWFKIPADPRQLWERHNIGPGIHGGISSAGVGDLNGDGHADVVRGDTWFENKDGKGLEWVAHQNIPMGRKGPFGECVRTVIADLDGDGKKSIVMCDADIGDSKIVILRNPDGHGETWTKQELPQSFTYGSLHSLAVADLNGDGRLDIVSNEQEELLPLGRQNPRWIAWENLGGGKYAEHILLDSKLGGHELQVADVDGDGDIDICSKAWGARPWNGVGGKMHVDYLENLLHDKAQPAASGAGKK
jgi:FG-GAP-like repeat